MALTPAKTLALWRTLGFAASALSLVSALTPALTFIRSKVSKQPLHLVVKGVTHFI